MVEKVYKGGSHAVIRDDSGRILVTHSWRGHTGLPGGKSDPGEGYVKTLRRELEEELGVKNFKYKLLLADKAVVDGKTFKSRVYDVNLNKGEKIKNREPKKIKLEWINPNKPGDHNYAVMTNLAFEKYRNNKMNKQAYLEDAYNSAFENEIEKLAKPTVHTHATAILNRILRSKGVSELDKMRSAQTTHEYLSRLGSDAFRKSQPTTGYWSKYLTKIKHAKKKIKEGPPSWVTGNYSFYDPGSVGIGISKKKSKMQVIPEMRSILEQAKSKRLVEKESIRRSLQEIEEKSRSNRTGLSLRMGLY